MNKVFVKKIEKFGKIFLRTISGILYHLDTYLSRSNNFEFSTSNFILKVRYIE